MRSAFAGGVALAALLALVLLAGAPAAAYPEHREWDREFSAPGAGDIVLADLTGDGWTDLAAADPAGGKIWIYAGTPQGLPQATQLAVLAPGIRDLDTADVDGDGRLDLLAADGQRALWLLPALNWTSGPGVPVTGAHRVAGGHLNGDDRVDLVVLGTTGASVWIQSDNRGFPEPFVLEDRVAFDDVAIADLDNDGRDDLVVAKAYEIRVFFQTALGLDLEGIALQTGGAGTAALGIVTRAGDVPLLVVASGAGGTGGSIGFWRWDGWAFRLDASVSGATAGRFAVGDVNDDRRADLTVANADGSLSVFLQQGAAFGDAAADWILTGSPASDVRVAVGDANGDGFPDVLVRADSLFRLYLQEDAMPRLTRAIPQQVVNRASAARGLVDLREFFADDHNRLTFTVVNASEPEHVTASVDGTFLDVDARDWYGEAEFRVAAWDGNPAHPAVESNLFTVVVNDVPRVTSVPVLRATAGEAYTYLVTVSDAYPVGDRPAFALLRGPGGMAIEATTGLLTWTPEAAGSVSVAVEVRDANGGLTVQEFVVVVAPSDSGGAAALLMAVGIVGSSTALLAAAALINENAKWLLLLVFLPLYTKIKRERILDHFVRGQIFGYITANPGDHYNAIKDALGLTNGSLAHHLRTLEREQFIKSKRFGLYRRFYPMNFRLPPDDMFQPNVIQQTILSVIRQSPGITQKEIAGRLGLTPPTVNYHIGVLSERNLILVERRGRSTHCSIVEGTDT